MKKKYLIRTLISIYDSFKTKNIFTLAAAVSFYAFMSIFPFFITLIYFSTKFFTKKVTITEMEDFINIFPPSMAETITANIDSIVKSGKVFSVISFIFLIFLAVKVFNMLEKALDIIYNTTEERIGWKANLKSFSFFMITAFILLIIFFFGNTVFIVTARIEEVSFFKAYDIILLTQVITEIIFFSMSYKYLSHKKLSWKRVFAGGFVTTFLWEILKHVFGLYMATIKMYSLVYGSIGSIILLQLWLYYSILIYLFGAEVSESL